MIITAGATGSGGSGGGDVNLTEVGGVAIALGQTTMSGSIPVTIASDQQGITSATATTSTVADNAASVTLLSANSSRRGATILNDSSASLYVKFGTTASLTSYTVRVIRNSYFEVPYGYTGRIDGIWATDPGDGAARITELT